MKLVEKEKFEYKMSQDKSLKKIAAYYDKRAKETDSIKAAGQWGSKEFVPEICHEICSKISIKNEDKVLEIGCGSGVLGNVVKNLCSLYAGIDISFEMLKKFEGDNKEDKINLFHSISSSIPLRNNFFDKVIMNSVTMYLNHKELEKTITEIKRIASKDATIFIGDNVIPASSYWELSWFQNLNSVEQKVAKPYIKVRKWLAKIDPKLAGKWKNLHEEISPEFIKEKFEEGATVLVSESATTKIKKKRLDKSETSKRVDFVIKFGNEI